MKTKILVSLLFSFCIAGCEEVSHPANLTVKVIDDQNNPITSANVGVTTFARWEPGEGFGTDIFDSSKAISDKNGEAKFQFPSKTGKIGIGVDAGNNYYRSVWPHHQYTKVEGGRWTPDNPTITYLLKRKLNPIPLYAKNLKKGLLVPVFGEKCGYDMEKGDWLPPHGKGQTIDIFFNVKSEQKENGDFTSSVEVTFPNEKDGLIFFKQNPHQGSELTSEHMAPVDGYQTSKLMSRYQVDRKITSEMDVANGNYYLRLRTSVDEQGKIQSANYAKIYGDFMYFTYYYNPTANDRNIEFDPKRNLFKGQDVTCP